MGPETRKPALVRYDLDHPDEVEDYFTRWGSYTHQARESFFPGWNPSSLQARRLQHTAMSPLSRTRDRQPSSAEDVLGLEDLMVVDVAHDRMGLKYRAEIFHLEQNPVDDACEAGVFVWRYDQTGGVRLVRVGLSTSYEWLAVSDYVGERRRLSHVLGAEDIQNTYPLNDDLIVTPSRHWLSVRIGNLDARSIRLYREICGAGFIGLAANLTKDAGNNAILDRALSVLQDKLRD